MKNYTRLHKWVRLEHGNGTALARRCGVSRQSVHNWQTGRANPAVEKRTLIDQATNGQVPADGWPE